MSDLIRNVQDVYKKWESKAPVFSSRGRRRSMPGGMSSSNQGMFRRGGSRPRSWEYETDSRPGRLRQRSRAQYFKLPRFEDLAHFKMSPSVLAENKPRPFMGACCSKCFPNSKVNVIDKRIFSMSVCNVLNIPHFQSVDINLILNFLKSKRPAYTDASIHVLKSEKVYSTVEKIARDTNKDFSENRGALAVSTNEEFSKAKTILDSIKTSVSTICCEISSVFVHHFLSRIFNSILVHKGQIELLKTLSKDGTPVIYLPVKCTDFDYILISFILYMNSLRVPLVILDSDLYIPILGYFTKFLGAIYINKLVEREKTKMALLESSVVDSYFAECLKAGHNLEFSIEGGRTRAQKPTSALSSLLSYAMAAVEEESIDDVYVSTISISYEKSIYGEYVSEQLVNSNSKETLYGKLCSIWRKLHCNFGNVRLNFGQPFSLKEFLSTCNKSKVKVIAETPPPSPCSLDDGESSCQNFLRNFQKSPIMTLFQHVTYDASVSISLMSTQLVSFLFMTQYRKGSTQQQLQNSLEWLRREVSNKKRDTGFTGESLPVIKRAVELLGKHLITTEVIDMEWTSSDLENNNVKVTVYKPVMKLPHVLELQYYADAVVPLFLLDSIVVNALYALVDVEICHFRHCDSKLFVLRDKIIDKAVELSDILQFEFIAVPPCTEITLSFNDVLDALIEKECLQLAGAGILPMSSMYSRRPHHLSFEASDEDESDYVESKLQHLKIELTEDSINNLEFLRSVLSPYIESYWIAAVSLLKLRDEIKEESVFIQEMQQTAQEKLSKGLLAYEESFSAATFKNSLKLFQHWRVVEYFTQDEIKILYLNESYNCKEKISDVIARIEQFRK